MSSQWTRGGVWSTSKILPSVDENPSKGTKQFIFCTCDECIAAFNEQDSSHQQERKRLSLWKPLDCCSTGSGFFWGLLTGALTAGLILAIVITLWLTSRKQALTTDVVTTNKLITATTITTTTVTSTTISTTTSATSTSTSTLSTTATTTTSTSTTASTTTTTTTSTTSTTASTVSITSNACTSGWSGVTLINLCTNCPDIDPYKKYTYTYTAIATQTRITFAIREDNGFFALDNITIRSNSAPGVELLSNGGFESGALSPWTYCDPASVTAPGTLKKTSDAFKYNGVTYAAQSGTYYYLDGAQGNSDYLFQKFATTIGETYTITFWLFNGGSGTHSNFHVILSI